MKAKNLILIFLMILISLVFNSCNNKSNDSKITSSKNNQTLILQNKASSDSKEINGDFSSWTQGDNQNPDNWILGGDGKGIIHKERKESSNSAKITHKDGNQIALYQDINIEIEKYKNNEFIFSCLVNSNKCNSVYLALYDGETWTNSPMGPSKTDQWEYLTAKGVIGEKSTNNIRLHLWVRNNATVYFNKPIFKVGLHESLKKENKDEIEYFLWSKVFNRKIYRSKASDIAMTFGDENNLEGYFYQNFFIYNLFTFRDYFCTPDDLIIAYNNKVSFETRAIALNWKINHNLVNNNQTAYVEYSYNYKDGFNPYVINGSNYGNILKTGWKNPPAIITVNHEMYYNENYVPMKITIKNIYKVPLRYIYIFQDGALMSDRTFLEKDLVFHQENVHQYWDDGEYDCARLWKIDKKNRKNKNNWMGMYNDRNDKLFAGTYAPPESKGVRWHATWDSTKPATLINENKKFVSYIDHYTILLKPSSMGKYNKKKIWHDDWFKFENLLNHVNTPDDKDKYDNPYGKIHGTAIDFGIINPGEERTQIIVKIMFSGYKDREDMHKKIMEIIARIPYYNIPSYDLDN